eukprot:SAG31_NODE_73_length_27793_cov_26.900520_12_plen_107_part_00
MDQTFVKLGICEYFSYGCMGTKPAASTRFFSSLPGLFGIVDEAECDIVTRRTWFGAWSDSARLTLGRSVARLSIRGTTPTVDTVRCDGAKPKRLGSDIARQAETTA